jgi:hypothetical protein
MGSGGASDDNDKGQRPRFRSDRPCRPVHAGQIPRKALTTLIIPELRHLEIPPTYPGACPSVRARSLEVLSTDVFRRPSASLPDLTFLDYTADVASRSASNMQSILLGTDDAAEDSADELDATAAVDDRESSSARVSGGGSLELLEGGVEGTRRAQAVMFTPREDDDGLAVGGGGGGSEADDPDGGGEIEGDEIGDFSD